MNGVIAAILGRHSVRRFTGDPVPGEILNQILEAARRAPSGATCSPGSLWSWATES